MGESTRLVCVQALAGEQGLEEASGNTQVSRNTGAQ